MNFAELRALLREADSETMRKSLDAESRQSEDEALSAAVRNLASRRMPSTKGQHQALRNRMSTLAKAMPNDRVLGGTSLESPVTQPARQFSRAEVEDGCRRALDAGAITAAEAAHIGTHLAMGQARGIPA
jgi:hypothetical protein